MQSSSLLTDRQRTELNRSVLAYLSNLGVPPGTLTQLRATIPGEFPVEDRDETRRQAQVLEKKWTSVVRLQRKVLDLESQVKALREELENSAAIGSTARKSKQDIANWLPRKPAKYSLSGHRQPITSIAFHNLFSVVASACEDGTIKVWDWELGELERTIKAHTKAVVDVDFGGPSQEVQLLASCSSDLTIKLWDPQNDYTNIKTLTGHDHTISAVRFTPSGNHLISASRDRTIRVWDVKTGYAIRTIHGHTDWIKSVAPSLDSEFILSAGIDQTARITQFSNGEAKLVFIGHEHVIENAVFAPKEAYPYLAALEGLKAPVSSSYSSSFEYIATASRDKTIKLWNTRQECIKTLVGHDNWVRELVFHPSGMYLISVSDDKTMRCWDLSQQGRCVKVIQDAHNHFISCIRWAPSQGSLNDDKGEKRVRCVLATGSVDLDVKIWA
ncbi:nuclear distribution protein Pac1p [Trichomonascus vanleenenianus]|uniref:Pac1p n=1 Tax=Trichomonascus vanleenenianus TaxID=2268995 RepID=UPI003EC9DA9B